MENVGKGSTNCFLSLICNFDTIILQNNGYVHKNVNLIYCYTFISLRNDFNDKRNILLTSIY